VPRPTAVTGDVLFARYAFPPNELGYCGPDDAGVLLRHATAATVPAPEITRRARLFDGAWPYLELIAAAAGGMDPLDARVVEAYWVGNELLDAVDPAVLAATVRTRFAGLGAAAARRLAAGPARAVAHHSFHVFTVYPWAALLRGPNPGTALSVLDSCRIRWGTVTGVDGDRVHVRGQPLAWDGSRLTLGPWRTEPVRWSTGDRPPGHAPPPGAVVACHWDWVCDRLTCAQAERLAARTADQLDAINP